jgi:hypothetical protein
VVHRLDCREDGDHSQMEDNWELRCDLKEGKIDYRVQMDSRCSEVASLVAERLEQDKLPDGERGTVFGCSEVRFDNCSHKVMDTAAEIDDHTNCIRCSEAFDREVAACLAGVVAAVLVDEQEDLAMEPSLH